MAALFTASKFSATDASGNPLAGGKVHTFAAGTTTPKATYTTQAGNVANANPVILDSTGRASIWLGSGAYKFVVTDSADAAAPDGTVDNVTAPALEVVADLASTASATKGAGLVAYRGPQDAPADTVAERLSWDVYVTDPQFGSAVNDGATDSTTALAAAAAYVSALCDISIDSVDVSRIPRLIFPPGLGFRTTATLTIRAGVQVEMHSPLWVVAAAGTPIVGIDMTDARGIDYQSPRQTRSFFDVRRVTQSDWASTSDIGVRITSLYVGDVFFRRIDKFAVSFDACLGYGYVRIGDIRDCRRSVIASRASPEQFTNQMRVVGGSFNCAGGVNTGMSRFGINIVSNLGCNSIVFDGQSFELNKVAAGAADCIPYLIDGTASPVLGVRAINQRTEANGSTFARLVGDVRACEFAILDGELEYTYPTHLMLDDQSTGGGGNVLYRSMGASGPQWETLFDTERLAERAVQLTGSVITLVNMECATSVGAAPTTQTFAASGAGVTFDTAGSMTASGPYFGTRVRLNGARTIGLSIRKPAATPADVVLLLFDSAGAQITTTGAVRIEQSTPIANTGVYGGVYSVRINESTDARLCDAVFQFSSSVATVFVAVPSKTDGWAIKRADSRATWFSATSHKPGVFVGAAIPISLTNVVYKAGMRVENIAPAVGSAKAWSLDSGATWRSEGNL